MGVGGRNSKQSHHHLEEGTVPVTTREHVLVSDYVLSIFAQVK